MSDHDDGTAVAFDLPFGKRVRDALYLHTSTLDELQAEYNQIVDTAMQVADVRIDAFNVVKLAPAQGRVSLLRYEAFFENSFPSLAESWTVDLTAKSARYRNYAQDGNPPILHRKETLLAPDHPLQREFQALTKAAEEAGLLENTTAIGRREAWEARLRRVGLRVTGNRLVDLESEATEEEIQRHRTALVRYSLSSPMQLLWRFGFLDGAHTVFDYGCGRGDDIRALSSRGLEAAGWDPYFAPDEKRRSADVVNLGFVLNVIEDPQERREALLGAWKLTEKVLAVAVLTGGRSVYEKYRLYRDGVITGRGTFQKYYSGSELREYVAETLNREPIAVGPGVLFVFKTDEAEQRFLADRELSRGPRTSLPSVPDAERPRVTRKRKTKWQSNRELVEAFWASCLDLGRPPEVDEFAHAAEVREKLGTPKSVLRRCLREFGDAPFEAARERRRADRLVYLALNMFERRRSFGSLPEPVRRDVKSLWGSYSAANAEARETLFSAGDPAALLERSQAALANGIGYLRDDRAFFIHASQMMELPALLRIYLGCASRVYGGFENADLIKLHIGSNKVSLMMYDDFEGRAIPLLQERIKITLGIADYQVFTYGGRFPPQPLLWKSRYLPEGFPNREKQLAFDEELADLSPLTDGTDVDADELRLALAGAKLQVRGFRLAKATQGPAATSSRSEAS